MLSNLYNVTWQKGWSSELQPRSLGLISNESMPVSNLFQIILALSEILHFATLFLKVFNVSTSFR